MWCGGECDGFDGFVGVLSDGIEGVDVFDFVVEKIEVVRLCCCYWI